MTQSIKRKGDDVMLMINGQEKNAYIGKSVAQFLGDNGDKKTFVAVECNGDIVPKIEYETRILGDEDTVEVVSFVGGG